MPVTNDFSQNASAFNCRLIAFKKLDIGRVPTACFYGNNRTMQERTTRDLAELKQRLVKVSADCKLTIVDRAIDQ